MAKKFGRDRKGKQRYRCGTCGRSFQRLRTKTLAGKLITQNKALAVLQHLVEGCSVRTTERLTNVHRDTILRLLRMAARKCEALMLQKIRGLPVKDVECDELWSFIGMKPKTKLRNGVKSDELGEAWTFTAIERHTKLILAWHLGQRSYEDTVIFTEKLAYATSGSFQVTTDGFRPYRDAISLSFGKRVHFAQLVKLYGGNPTEAGGSRVRAKYTGSAKEAVHGYPKAEEVSTSHVERHNLSIRMETRRFTRRTNAFSKKWANHHAALALYFGYYNFCRVHGTLGKTPAMAANLTDSVWTLKNLLRSATQV